MFAKLRPGHRRSGSTPTSPSPNQIPSGFLPVPPSSSHGPTSPNSIEDFLHGFKSPAGQASGHSGQTGHSSHAPVTMESPISPVPPALPPIPRVASVYEKPQESEGTQGLGLGLSSISHHPELHRAKTQESFESQSSGSPILGEHVFSPPQQEQWLSQEQQLRDARSPSEHYRSPSGSLLSPPSRGGAGISESEFRSILQGKHLPPLPGQPGNAARRPSELVSPPPMVLHEETPHPQTHPRSQVMSLGNQSKQSLASIATAKTSDRSGKTKTRLLNPMSLLLRRRNGQALEQLSEESLVSHRIGALSPGLPDNYDPSIRGKLVHNFDAPRPRRNFSNQNVPEIAEKERRESISRERQQKSTIPNDEPRQQHTPVFKEHFENELDATKADSAIRAENLANKDFVARNSLLAEDAEVMLPPFARMGQKTVYKPLVPAEPPSIPSPPPPPVPAKDQSEDSSASRFQPQLPPLSPLLEDPTSPDHDATPKRSSQASTVRQSTQASTRTPASIRSSRASNISRMNSGASASGLPAHMFSRASRFSFQYGSADSSAQEKLLEEKHREKAAKAKAEGKRVSLDAYGDGEDDDFDYNDMDLEGMDDDVPINGESWDYGGGLGIGNMTLDDMQSGGGLGGRSLDDFENGMDDDFGGGGLGNMTLDDMPGTGGLGNMTLEDMLPKAVAQEPLDVPVYNPLKEHSPQAARGTAQEHSVQQGLEVGITEGKSTTDPAVPSHRSSTSLRRKPVGVTSTVDQDDFYFEDGEFADEDFLREINGEHEDLAGAFDESVFDDPTHHLYERKKVLPAPPIPRMSSKRTHNTLKGRKPQSRPPSEPLPEHPDPSAPSHQVEAYQSALAMYMDKAAAAGRFDRKNSVDSTASSLTGGPVRMASITEPPLIAEQPELSPDVARLSQESSPLSPPTVRASGGNELDSLSKSVGFMFPGHNGIGDSYPSDFDYSDYDSTFEDDPMIAAANAEALENDDEGIYGTEFGFYARPGASDYPDEATEQEKNSMYGGYFGPKNWGEVKRQRSTREPNLTPITERSEYSTRNSFIGLGFAEHERGAPSPALAQLARMSPGWEGDMSMDSLLKLRRAQWGGSSSSPRASSTSPMNNASPILAKDESKPSQQQMWSSSPMSRNMFSPGDIPEADADDEYDEDMLAEANYDEEEEEYGDEGEADAGALPADDGFVSPLDDSPTPESPTIRANLPLTSQSPSISPMKLTPGFSFPATASDNIVSPITTTTTTSPSTTLVTSGTAITTPLVTHSQRSSAVLISPISPVSGGSAETTLHKRGHSRSGSDSVSYSRERDKEKGEFRWMLERRRTAEDGVEVLVERTAVEGGRI